MRDCAGAHRMKPQDAKIPDKRRRLWLSPVIVLAGLFATSCVSSTLEAPNPAPTALTSELALTQEELQIQQSRADGIAQIRAKADASPVNEAPPAYGVPRRGEVALLTPEEIAAKTNRLNSNSAQVNAQLPDEELLQKKRKIAEMQRKAATHFQEALKQIENE